MESQTDASSSTTRIRALVLSALSPKKTPGMSGRVDASIGRVPECRKKPLLHTMAGQKL